MIHFKINVNGKVEYKFQCSNADQAISVWRGYCEKYGAKTVYEEYGAYLGCSRININNGTRVTLYLDFGRGL